MLEKFIKEKFIKLTIKIRKSFSVNKKAHSKVKNKIFKYKLRKTKLNIKIY